MEQLQIQNQNMQMNIGFMINSVDGLDPAFMKWEKSNRAKASDLWANLFSKGNPNCIHVNIPCHWAQFFTVLLLSPDKFSWAKDFLSSKLAPF